jgi:cobalt/nickel transport system permease protein
LHFDLSDQYQPRASLVHDIDPRAKVVSVVLLILAVSLCAEGSWLAFGAIFTLLLLLCTLARLGPFYAVRRSYIALPFALVALALPFTVPGPTLLRLPALNWVVTVPGAVRFGSVLLRTWLAVQAALLLSAVVRFPDMLWALGSLGLPRTLVSTIGFLFRYSFVLLDETSRMLRARAARSAHLPGTRNPSLLWQGSVAGRMVGSLFLRSVERSERVYAAMSSRGYDGRFRPLLHFRMRRRDWLALAAIVLALLAIVWLSLGR